MTALLSVERHCKLTGFLPAVTHSYLRDCNHISLLLHAFILSRRNPKLLHVPVLSFHQSVGQVLTRQLATGKKGQVPLWEGLTEQQYGFCEGVGMLLSAQLMQLQKAKASSLPWMEEPNSALRCCHSSLGLIICLHTDGNCLLQARAGGPGVLSSARSASHLQYQAFAEPRSLF